MPSMPRSNTIIEREQRSSTEVRELLLAAAVEEFSARRFAGTTVQGIADAAGLTASALDQHFESKSDLFSHAVLRPFLTFLDGFSAVWQRQRKEP
jgi:AcrR family transcriptional regulator